MQRDWVVDGFGNDFGENFRISFSPNLQPFFSDVNLLWPNLHKSDPLCFYLSHSFPAPCNNTLSLSTSWWTTHSCITQLILFLPETSGERPSPWNPRGLLISRDLLNAPHRFMESEMGGVLVWLCSHCKNSLCNISAVEYSSISFRMLTLIENSLSLSWRAFFFFF